MTVIETRGLSRNFKNVVAVTDLTLDVTPGEVLGFLGPNGAGKTTTIRLLAGMIAPTSGYASVGGLRTDAQPEKLHEVIGLLTESPGFYDNLTARVNLEYFAGFYPGLDVPVQVEKYLRLVGLWELRERRAGTFSKGMKQRLALARALVHEPKVLFLDEPTAGLDPESAREVRDLIKGFSREGRTVFLSTHNLNEAELLCQRIAVIHTRLLALDTPERLRRRLFRRRIVVRLQNADEQVTAAVRALPFVQDLREEGGELTVELADPERNRPALVRAVVEAGGEVVAVNEKQYPLEEVYLRLIHEESGDAE
jgi:ABC-2 type transport system ATP-binding protein